MATPQTAPPDRSGRARVLAYIAMPLVALVGIGMFVLGFQSPAFLAGGVTLVVLAVVGLLAARGGKGSLSWGPAVALIGIVATVIVALVVPSPTGGDNSLINAFGLAVLIAAVGFIIVLLARAAATRRS